MAQKDPSKTEAATAKRREKAREKGDVPKSQELTKAVTTAAGMVGLSAYMGVMVNHLKTLFQYFLSEGASFSLTPQSAYAVMVYVAQELAVILLPILFLIAISGWVCMRMQVGALWVKKEFKLNMNIFAGITRMFGSIDTLVRLGRSLLQAVLIGSIPYFVIISEFDNFLPLFYGTANSIAAYIGETSYRIVLYTLPPMFIIGALDLWYNRYQHEEKLKMTKDEVKDERKNAEGDPLVKSKQRQEMMKVMARRMLQDVPKADVVITNPTHIAVALRYNVMEAPAPVVLAIGVDHLAEKIKAVAREHHVPIRENVPLARALYKSVDVGEMIPAELYKAVAAILAGVWRLKGKTMG